MELVDKSDLSGFIESSNLDKKIATLVTKAELKAKKDKIIRLKAFKAVKSYFCGKSYFENYGKQNYLVFQSIYRCFKKIDNTEHISA